MKLRRIERELGALARRQLVVDHVATAAADVGDVLDRQCALVRHGADLLAALAAPRDDQDRVVLDDGVRSDGLEAEDADRQSAHM